jgi:hypothetical protein
LNNSKLGKDRQTNPTRTHAAQTRAGRVERIEMIITMGLSPKGGRCARLA